MIGHVGVCSWSLGASSPEELAQSLVSVGARCVQLALDPIRTGAWSLERTQGALDDAGIVIVSGMMAMEGEDYSTLEAIRNTGGVRSNEHWEANCRAIAENARVAAELGLWLVTFHAGFLPHDKSDPERAVLLDRLGMILDLFDEGEAEAMVGFETGQETVETLIEVIDDLHPTNLGVNFDPANMILYGMGDPCKALRDLGANVVQAHVKDALPAQVPGTWGSEVVVGTGAVDWKAFFETIEGFAQPVDLFVEREAGDAREEDIRTALEFIIDSIGKGDSCWMR